MNKLEAAGSRRFSIGCVFLAAGVARGPSARAPQDAPRGRASMPSAQSRLASGFARRQFVYVLAYAPTWNAAGPCVRAAKSAYRRPALAKNPMSPSAHAAIRGRLRFIVEGK